MARKPPTASKPGFTLSYEVEESDIAAFHDYHLWRHSRRAPAALCLIAGGGTAVTVTTGAADPWTTAMLAAVLPVAAFFWTMAHSRRRMIRLARQTGIIGPQTLEVTPRGFRQRRGDGVETRRQWSEPLRIVETAGHLFLYVNPTQAVILPCRAFPTPEERDRFLASLREWSAAGQ